MVALGCEPDSRVSRSEDAGLGTAGEQIIGGVITTDRSEVGLLLPGCTATLVENPYTVLTAAHCVASTQAAAWRAFALPCARSLPRIASAA